MPPAVGCFTLIDHPYSRFDIVVAEPFATLTTFGKETVVVKAKRTTTTDDPLRWPRCMIVGSADTSPGQRICHFQAALDVG